MNKRKLISLILSIAVLLSILAQPAFAQSTTPNDSTISKVSATVSEKDGKASDITITTANYFDKDNYYGRNKRIYSITGLTRDSGNSYYAKVNSSSRTYYINWVNDDIAYFSDDTSKEIGEYTDSFVILVSGNTTLEYNPASLSYQIVDSLPLGTISNDVTYDSYQEFNYSVDINVPINYSTDELKLEMLNSDNEVVAVSGSNVYNYTTYVSDSRYNIIYEGCGDSIYSRIRNIYGSVYVGELLPCGVYSVRVTNSSGYSYIAKDSIILTDKPIVQYNSYTEYYPQAKSGDSKIYLALRVNNGNIDDFKLGLYDSTNNLVAQSSDYIVSYKYDNEIETVHELRFKDGKYLSPGNYIIRLITNKEYCDISYSNTLYINENNSGLNIEVNIPDPTKANLYLISSGFENDTRYKFALKQDKTVIAETIAKLDSRGNFDLEFKNTDGTLVELNNNTQYMLTTYVKSNSSWSERMSNSFYNYYQANSDEGAATKPDLYGYSYFSGNEACGYFYIKNELASNIDSTKLKLKITNPVTGEVKILDNLTVTSQKEETHTYYTVRRDIDTTNNLAYGNYMFKIYNGDSEMVDDEGNNIFNYDYYKQYYGETGSYPSLSSSRSYNNEYPICGISNVKSASSVQIKLYKLTNTTMIPDKVITLEKYEDWQDFYAITSKNSTGVDFSQKYRIIAEVDGKAASTSTNYIIPMDFTPAESYSITVVQPDNGTLSPSAISGKYGDKIYVYNTPAEGYEYVPGSLTVNGGSADGRVFRLVEDSVLTAQFGKAAVLTPHSITIDSSITNGTISVNSSTAKADDKVTVTVTPDEYYRLQSLYYIDSLGRYNSIDINTLSFIMPDSDITLKAYFTSLKYNINVNSYNPNYGEVSVPNQSLPGEQVTVTATPKTGYKVSSIYYYEAGQKITIDNNNSTFTMPEQDISLSVNFVPENMYNVAVIANEGGSILTCGSSSNLIGAEYGAPVDVVATPNEGYKVKALYYKIDGSDTVYPIVNNSNFTMPEADITIYVEFKVDPKAAPYTYEQVKQLFSTLCSGGTITADDIERYDMNSDNIITGIDFTLLLRKVLGN